MSRWDLPVPLLSPIRQSDWPLATQPQPAKVLMVAGLIAVFAVKSKIRQGSGPGESGFVDPTGRPALFPVVAFGEQQLGQECPVGQLFAAGSIGDLGVAVPERRQSQQPGGAI